MLAGPLRYKVTVQTQGSTVSATGAVTRTWTNLFTGWASIMPQSAKEYWSGKTQVEAQNVRIIMRDCSDLDVVDASCRIVWGSKKYNIESVTRVQERGRMIEFGCVEGEKDID